ncbi:hypothetical protein ABBQ32_001981 [Trebouxia sp. C0010 RCD-2024]
MSQRQQQFPYELSAVDSTASLYQASQSTPSLVPWQQQASETPELYGASGLPCGDPHLVNGGIQSRVDDWAGQAVAVTLQQGMTDANEPSGQAGVGPTTDQPVSPAHSNSSQRALQLQQQQYLQQHQLKLIQQQQQNQMLQQQQQILQHQQSQQGLNQQGQTGLLGHLSGMGGQYSQPMAQSNLMGAQSFGMSGLTGQLPQFSEGMATGLNPNGLPPPVTAQHPPNQHFVGQIPAGHRQQLDARAPGSLASSVPSMPGFGMVGQLPEHSLNRPMVGQLPPSMYQQPASFAFQQQLTSQQLNFPLASAQMQSNSQFGFGAPFSMPANPGLRPVPMFPGARGDSVDGSVYNFPESVSVVSRGSAAPPPAAPPVVSLASLSTQHKVKMLCSSGGHFGKVPGGGLEYQGGETRLVSVSNYCHMQELQDALHRVSQTMRLDLSSSSGTISNTKYQLPGSACTYIDLVDDEDVKLMFDEWAAWMQEEGKATRAAKLHVFIDWQSSSTSKRSAGGSGQVGGGLDTISETASADTPVARAPPPPCADENTSAGSAGSVPIEPLHGSEQTPLERIASTMEIIDPRDITLVKFLGSGGYGEVHLGKWHSSEAAIKCLNPSLFFQGGDAGGQAAIAELIQEATLLSRMRHPNVVWVYGVVLKPMSKDDESNDAELSDHDGGDAIELAAALARQPQTGGAGVVRPPAIVVEYMGQGSLKGALYRKADIVQGALIRVLIAMDAAKGMEYLHSKHIVHFDLKSANLLLGYKDRRAICKVADFGLSKQKRDTYVSNVSSQRGTLPWIAPEIIKTPHEVTEKVDVYSFGVVLWELWTGREPYDGINYHALLHQITTSKGLVRPPMPNSPQWDHEHLPELTPGYKDLIEACWKESPSDRPTFRDIVAKLKGMAQVLRPPPKRRPSQIVTQASAASSQPSSQLTAASSQPGSLQLPNIKKCAALAEQPTVTGPSIPKAQDSTPAAAAAGVATAAAGTPKAEAGTDQDTVGPSASMQKPEASADKVAADADTTTSQAEASADQVVIDTTAAGASETSQDKAANASAFAAAALQTSAEELPEQEGAEKPPVDKPGSEEYVSPFEQAQEGAHKQGLSPFANIS